MGNNSSNFLVFVSLPGAKSNRSCHTPPAYTGTWARSSHVLPWSRPRTVCCICIHLRLLKAYGCCMSVTFYPPPQLPTLDGRLSGPGPVVELLLAGITITSQQTTAGCDRSCPSYARLSYLRDTIIVCVSTNGTTEFTFRTEIFYNTAVRSRGRVALLLSSCASARRTPPRAAFNKRLSSRRSSITCACWPQGNGIK